MAHHGAQGTVFCLDLLPQPIPLPPTDPTEPNYAYLAKRFWRFEQLARQPATCPYPLPFCRPAGGRVESREAVGGESLVPIAPAMCQPQQGPHKNHTTHKDRISEMRSQGSQGKGSEGGQGSVRPLADVVEEMVAWERVGMGDACGLWQIGFFWQVWAIWVFWVFWQV